MKSHWAYTIILYAVLATAAKAIPVESEANSTAPTQIALLGEPTNNNDTETNSAEHDLETAATEDKAVSTDYEDNISALVEGASHKSGQGNILDAFQQYVNHYGGASYPAYAPIGGYPAPVGYGSVPVPVPVSAVYPNPYGVQTTYEGYLVPANKTPETGNSISNLLSTLNPVGFFTNTLPLLMMSTVFRVIAGIISAIGMFFFSGALSNFLCNLTPLCDMASSTITFFTRRGVRSEDVGRMLSEELTPERIKQAEEFVRSAIRKYRDLQKVYQPLKSV